MMGGCAFRSGDQFAENSGLGLPFVDTSGAPSISFPVKAGAGCPSRLSRWRFFSKRP